MVERQLRGAGSATSACWRRWRACRASCSCPERLREHAYDDGALPIGYGQTISQPYMVARDLRGCSRSTGDERVLDVGTGSGYAAAVLAELAAEVISIERIPELAEQARARPRRGRATSTSTSASATARSALPGPRALRRDRRRRRGARDPAGALRAARAGRPARAPRRRPGGSGSCSSSQTPEGPAERALGPVPVRPARRRGGLRALTVASATRRLGYPSLRRLRSSSAEARSALTGARGVGGALRRRSNWVQLAKFCAVGATGYVVNLAVYTLLVHGARPPLPRRPRSCSFLVAVTNNYMWNRLWTFRAPARPCRLPGLRFLVVSPLALVRKPASSCTCSSRLGVGEVLGAGDRDRARHAGELRRQQAVVLPARVSASACASSRSLVALAPRRAGDRHRARLRRAGTAIADAVRAAGGAAERSPRCRRSPRFLADPKVARLARPLPDRIRTTDADFDRRRAAGRCTSGRGRPARSPPAWSTTPAGACSRRGPGRRSPGRWRAAARRLRRQGRSTSWPSGSRFCAVFFLGLADLRRPLSLRNLDLLVLLSFAVSLWLLQPRRGLHERAARVSAAALPARAHRLDRLRAAARCARRAVVAGLGARRGARSSSSASASGSTSRRRTA